jgi:hypothetical protein
LEAKAVDFSSVKGRTVAVVLVVAAALAASARASACGAGGYSYAGLAAPAHAFGIGASITPLASFSISTGHVAGWVGVGGPHQGPAGTDEWLQVGYNAIGGIGGPNLYFEVTRAGNTTYHQVAANVPGGHATRVAVLEMHKRPNWWRVWVDGSPASAPINLPGSHGRWAPMATAESWDGGTSGTCNQFLYRFHRIAVAHAPGGAWAPLAHGHRIGSASMKVTYSSFLAAQGAEALRSLASFSP